MSTLNEQVRPKVKEASSFILAHLQRTNLVGYSSEIDELALFRFPEDLDNYNPHSTLDIHLDLDDMTQLKDILRSTHLKYDIS